MVERIAHSIRGKLLLLIVAVTFVALFVSAIALVVYEARTYRERWVQDLQTQAEILGVSSIAALAFDDRTAARENLELLRARPAILAAAIYDEHGELFASFHGVATHQVPPRLKAAQDGAAVEGGRVVLSQRISDRNTYQGAVYLVATYGMYERIAGYGAILLVVMLLSLALAVFVGLWLQKKITEPLLAVTETAHQVIETRDFSLRVTKTTSDEIVEGSVVVEVADNGIGMAPELVPQVFNMFTQADTALDRQVQTGLGGASRSRSVSSSCTAARSKRAAAVPAAAAGSLSRCRCWRRQRPPPCG